MKELVYQPLTDFLAAVPGTKISLSFPKIEDILGRKLPPTAYGSDTWWTNNPTGHSQAKAWRAAGFEMTNVDRAAMTVTFKRAGTQGLAGEKGGSGMSEAARTFEQEGMMKKTRRHPAWGALKGFITIEPGYDLTSPSMSDEEIAEMEANLERTAALIEEGMARKNR